MTTNKMQTTLHMGGEVIERQFAELLSFIENKRSEASQAVNEKQLYTAWVVGGYVSAKLKSEEWGSKVVTQFVEYVKATRKHRFCSKIKCLWTSSVFRNATPSRN